MPTVVFYDKFNFKCNSLFTAFKFSKIRETPNKIKKKGLSTFIMNR